MPLTLPHRLYGNQIGDLGVVAFSKVIARSKIYTIELVYHNAK